MVLNTVHCLLFQVEKCIGDLSHMLSSVDGTLSAAKFLLNTGAAETWAVMVSKKYQGQPWASVPTLSSLCQTSCVRDMGT